MFLSGSRLVAAIACIAATAVAQPGPPPPRIPVPQHLYSPYWSIAYGHESVIQLHNNLIDQPLTVGIALYSPAGARTNLPAVQLGPLGNASVDMRGVLNQQGVPGLTEGSAVFEYLWPNGGALSAETSVSEPARTVIYTIIADEKGASPGTLSSVYWFPPGEHAEVYAALHNKGSSTVHATASIEAYGRRIPLGTLTLGPNQSGVLEGDAPTRALSRTDRASRYGSVILTHDAPDGALIASGWIEMEDNGYSNMMTFDDPGRHRGTTLYGSQIFVGARNDIFASGRATRVDSHLVLMNTSDAPVRPRGELAYEVNGQMIRMALGIGVLGPREVRAVNIGGPAIPTDTSTGALVLTYDGPEGAIMGRVFGVADEVTFGFYTTLETHGAPLISELYWSTGGDANTLLTVTNVGDEPDQVKIEVTYNGGKLDLDPIPLAPLQSYTLKVRDLRVC